MVATFWAGEFYGQKSLADRIGAQMGPPPPAPSPRDVLSEGCQTEKSMDSRYPIHTNAQ